MTLRRDIVFKYIFVYIVFILLGIVSVVRMADIQSSDGELAQRELRKRALQKVPVIAQRGNIMAHDGSILAASMQVYEVRYDFTAVKDSKLFNLKIDSIARGLSAILGEYNAAEYKRQWLQLRAEAITKRANRYHPISRRRIDYPALQRLKRLPLLRLGRHHGGLIVEAHMERIYPYDQLARQTLGWINKQQSGVGIEYSYQKEIAGKAGWEWRQRVSRNAFAPISSHPDAMPINGSDIVCTIDLDLQQIAEEAIVQQLKACPELEWGCAVLMEVHTGAVRAIANKHKEARTGAIVEDDNYALRYRKDPGSTFKLISFMVMLEKGLDLGQRVATGDGSVRIGDKLYEDEGSKGGGMSAAQVFINSSNAGTVQLIRQTYPQRRDWHDFVERIDAMGIRGITKFDIDPRQDIAPVIRMASDDYLALYAMSIGVSLEMTPLQTLTIYNAIAGGGRMVHPFFVHEVRRDGRTTYSRRQGLLLNKALCSPQTLERLQRLLCAVVDSGTARRARSPMLAIAGKTGTAHIAEGSGGYTNKKLASFAGYFPAQRPRYSGIVAFRTYETTGKTYGGMYAAPVFRAIAEKTYASSSFWKGVAAQEALLLQSSASSADYQRGGGVPYTKSGSMALLQKALSALSIPAAANAAAQWVTAAALDSVVLMQPRAAVSGLMPDVVGMGVMDAVYLLEEQGLRVHLRGRGTIVSQTPKAGAPYDRGDMVSLELTMNN